MIRSEAASEYSKPKELSFSPYDDNGGSIVAVAGETFAVIASDSRLSTGYTIYTRNQNRLFPLSDKTVLATAGCWADSIQLLKQLKANLQHYTHNHNRAMPTLAVAQMLSIALYYKRFFPYYLSNIVAGLDSEGKGCVFSYDPIGNFERSTYRAAGSSGALLQPLLDNQVGHSNVQNPPTEPLSVEKAVALVKDVFISAAERDIQCGDSVQISIITQEGIKNEVFELRKD